MDNEPQGQAGKRVVDSFSFASIAASATPSRYRVAFEAVSANKQR